jgi:hypothetical protein
MDELDKSLIEIRELEDLEEQMRRTIQRDHKKLDRL